MAVDAASVALACMADLGRLRQDELPLSKRSRGGPTFVPKSNNGASKFSKHLKQELQTKWSIVIYDEESEQMDGLEIDDARPWDKRPATIKQTQKNKQLMEELRRQTSTSSTKERKSCDDPDATAATSSTPVTSVPTTQYAFRGLCQVTIASSAELKFKSQVMIRVFLDSNTAELVILSPTFTDSVFLAFNVLDVQRPVMQEDTCLITGAAGKAGRRLLIQSTEVTTTKTFCTILEKTQESAMRFAREGAVFVPGSAQTAQKPTAPKSTNDSIPEANFVDEKHLMVPPKDSSKLQPQRSKAELLNQTGSTNIKQEIQIQHAPADNLISATCKLLVDVFTKYDAVSSDFFDNNIEEIEDQAIFLWQQNGLLSSETENKTNELLKILKLIIQAREGFKNPPRYQDVTQDKESHENSIDEFDGESKLIRYTMKELLDLDNFFPLSNQIPKEINIQRDSGGNKDEIATSYNGPVGSGLVHDVEPSSGDKIFEPLVTVSEVDTSMQENRKPKGLASSRWA